MTRHWIAVAIACSLSACAAGGSSGPTVEATPRAAHCGQTGTKESRRVQRSRAFQETAWVIARSRMTDAAGAHAHVTWLCGALRLYSLPGLAGLHLAAALLHDEPHLVDVVFAMDQDTVVLLSPLRAGFPVGGLDTATWNRFITDRGGLSLREASPARAVACALHRIQELVFVHPECRAGEILSQTKAEGVWILQFGDGRAGTFGTLRLSEGGQVR